MNGHIKCVGSNHKSALKGKEHQTHFNQGLRECPDWTAILCRLIAACPSVRSSCVLYRNTMCCTTLPETPYSLRPTPKQIKQERKSTHPPSQLWKLEGTGGFI